MIDKFVVEPKAVENIIVELVAAPRSVEDMIVVLAAAPRPVGSTIAGLVAEPQAVDNIVAVFVLVGIEYVTGVVVNSPAGILVILIAFFSVVVALIRYPMDLKIQIYFLVNMFFLVILINRNLRCGSLFL